MRIAIVGRKTDTTNYVRYVRTIGAVPFVTLRPAEVISCHGLILPGGGDITPAFFGEQNHGSKSIDTELDIIQLQALDAALRNRIPILGICKGMQIINVGLGGTLHQHLITADIHRYINADQYHPSNILENSWLYKLYGNSAIINSAHHQGLKTLGSGLCAVQYCPIDHCIEAITHLHLPIWGVQWHPERLDETKSGITGQKILTYFSSFLSVGQATAK